MRRVIPYISELLIVTGAVIGLFLFWQFYWTNAQYEGKSHEIVDEFFDDASKSGDKFIEDGDLTKPGKKEKDDSTSDSNTRTSYPTGRAWGVLIVPRWEGKTQNRMPILEGTSQSVLNQAAAGHYPDSQMPGELGNAALAAHRRTYGNSFRYINELKNGDKLVISTKTTWYVYEVYKSYLVSPRNGEVVAPVPGDPWATPTKEILTLTTCHGSRLGAYGNDQRWIIHAELVGTLERSEGIPAAVRGMKGVR